MNRLKYGLTSKNNSMLVEMVKKNKILCKELRELFNQILEVKYGRLNTLYVSKDIRSKGKKSFNPHEFINYRTCQFHNKKIRIKEREILSQYDNFNDYSQFGFGKGISVIDVVNIKDIKNLANLDLSNAFNQIKNGDIYFLLKRIGYDKVQAGKITRALTNTNGELYQGGTFSPMMYNIFQLPLMYRLKGVERNIEGLEFVSYADDINILWSESAEYKYIGWGFIKFISSIFEDLGWEINLNKTHFATNREWKSILGYQVNGKQRRTKGNRKRKNKIRLIKWLIKNNYPYYNKYGKEVDKQSALQGHIRHMRDFTIKGLHNNYNQRNIIGGHNENS